MHEKPTTIWNFSHQQNNNEAQYQSHHQIEWRPRWLPCIFPLSHHPSLELYGWPRSQYVYLSVLINKCKLHTRACGLPGGDDCRSCHTATVISSRQTIHVLVCSWPHDAKVPHLYWAIQFCASSLPCIDWGGGQRFTHSHFDRVAINAAIDVVCRSPFVAICALRKNDHSLGGQMENVYESLRVESSRSQVDAWMR